MVLPPAQKSEETPTDTGTFVYGGVTYDKKTGKVVLYPKSMEDRCMLVCLNNTKTEDDCSDCCVEKIPISDPGCLNFCITSCQDYYSKD